MANKSDLFLNLNRNEIEEFLKTSRAISINLKKGEELFLSGSTPKYLFILESGSVVVENVDINGKRSVVNIFKDVGTVFGEVYLYVDKSSYDFSAYANSDSRVLKIPKEAFKYTNEQTNPKIINNMLKILADKAYYLNQKLLILSSVSLRQKLIKYILQNSQTDELEFKLNREDLANFLGTTRPSISRELMNMQKNGLIDVEKNKIKFSREKLLSLI